MRSCGRGRRLPSVGVHALCRVLLALAAHAESGGGWTNLNGHALNAEPVAIKGKTITFKQGDSEKTVDYPLALFLPMEQERLRIALKDASVPDGLQSAYAFTARVLKRSRLLFENGQTTQEAYQQSLATALAAFHAQAAPLLEQQKLSKARLDLIAAKLANAKD